MAENEHKKALEEIKEEETLKMKRFWKWMESKGYVRLNKYTKCYVFNGVLTHKNIPDQMMIGFMLEYLHTEMRNYELDTGNTIHEHYLRLTSFIKNMYKII